LPRGSERKENMKYYYKEIKETIQQKNNRFYTRRDWLQAVVNGARNSNGLPKELDAIKGAGNAVVPQCVEMIFNLPAFDYWRI